jgi:hypothetical protein
MGPSLAQRTPPASSIFSLLGVHFQWGTSQSISYEAASPNFDVSILRRFSPKTAGNAKRPNTRPPQELRAIRRGLCHLMSPSVFAILARRKGRRKTETWERIPIGPRVRRDSRTSEIGAKKTAGKGAGRLRVWRYVVGSAHPTARGGLITGATRGGTFAQETEHQGPEGPSTRARGL